MSLHIDIAGILDDNPRGTWVRGFHWGMHKMMLSDGPIHPGSARLPLEQFMALYFKGSSGSLKERERVAMNDIFYSVLQDTQSGTLDNYAKEYDLKARSCLLSNARKYMKTQEGFRSYVSGGLLSYLAYARIRFF